MRRRLPLLLPLLLAAFAAAQTSAQTRPAPGVQVLRLGAASVRLPAPEGFVEATAKSERVRQYFTTSESPENEMLAVHMPAGTVEGIDGGQTPMPDFYTKVSVLRRAKEMDMSPAGFASLIGTIDRQGSKLFDPKNPDTARKLKEVESRVNAASQNGSQLTFDGPEVLGVFEKSPNVYSMLMLVKLNVTSAGGQSTQIPVLAAASFVRVRARVLFVYVYRRFNAAEDADRVKTFARRWNEQIIAANRV